MKLAISFQNWSINLSIYFYRCNRNGMCKQMLWQKVVSAVCVDVCMLNAHALNLRLRLGLGLGLCTLLITWKAIKQIRCVSANAFFIIIKQFYINWMRTFYTSTTEHNVCKSACKTILSEAERANERKYQNFIFKHVYAQSDACLLSLFACVCVCSTGVVVLPFRYRRVIFQLLTFARSFMLSALCLCVCVKYELQFLP